MPPAWPRRSPPAPVPGLRPGGVHNKENCASPAFKSLLFRKDPIPLGFTATRYFSELESRVEIL